MKPYEQWDINDLENACKERHLNAANIKSNKKLANAKKRYIAALKQADKEMTFPFLDLPPELRTRVYGHMLMFDNAWGCHPQILATSKQINKEATNVLYGDNLIEVKVWHDVVQAHDVDCGINTSHTVIKANERINGLVWPPFLRRAQFIRISFMSTVVTTQDGSYAYPLSTDSTMFIQILYVLCTYLAGSHSLRSFDMDLGVLYPAIFSDPHLPHVGQALAMLKKPLQVRIRTGNPLNLPLQAHNYLFNTGNAGNVLRACFPILEEVLAYERALPMLECPESAWTASMTPEQLTAFRTNRKTILNQDDILDLSDDTGERDFWAAVVSVQADLDRVAWETMEGVAKDETRVIMDELRRYRSKRKGEREPHIEMENAAYADREVADAT